MRQRLEVTDSPGARKLAHLRHRGGNGAKIRAPMHERERARLGGKLQRPVERRVATAKDDQVLIVQIRGAAHAVLNMRILEGLRALNPDTACLKRADARGDHHRRGIERRACVGAHQKTSRLCRGKLGYFLSEMKLGRERLDLLQQPINKLLRAAYRQRWD